MGISENKETYVLKETGDTVIKRPDGELYAQEEYVVSSMVGKQKNH